VTLANDLWLANADLAQAALEHPFVAGLADGTTPAAAFGFFIAQDAYFLDSFARAYALALARSPDAAGVAVFADLVGGVRDELRLHSSYAARWGIDMSTVEPAPATVDYTDFLLATAAVGDPGRICAAMTPCMRLYAHLGQALSRGRTSDTYREWIDTYAGADFETLATTLEDLLDRYSAGSERDRTTYRRAMTLEVRFFDAAGSA
jgi:thiaminase/transcriptional activator TenA